MSDDRPNPMEGFPSLMTFIGGFVPERGRFIGEAIFSGLYTATTFGLISGNIGAFVTTTTTSAPLGFLIGTSIGYPLGIYHFWKNCKSTTSRIARNYPTLLAHALWTESNIVVPANLYPSVQKEVPRGKTTTGTIDDKMYNSLEEWVQSRGMRQYCACVLAALSCRGDVDEIERQNRQKIIESYSKSEEDEDEE